MQEDKFRDIAKILINDPLLVGAITAEWHKPNYELNSFEEMIAEEILDRDEKECSNKLG